MSYQYIAPIKPPGNCAVVIPVRPVLPQALANREQLLQEAWDMSQEHGRPVVVHFEVSDYGSIAAYRKGIDYVDHPEKAPHHPLVDARRQSRPFTA